MFRPFSRKKATGQKKKRHAQKGCAKSSPNKGSGAEARKMGANAGAPDGWRLDYSKMVEDMRNIDISSLQVVELPSTSGQKSTGGSTDRNSFSIPLNIVQQDTSRKERPAADKSLPDGWTELTSRTTGKIYFGNIHTGQSSWERPTQPATQVRNETVTSRAAPAVSIPSLQLQEDDSDGEIVEERSDIAPAQGHDAAGTRTQDQRPAHQPDRLNAQEQQRMVMASHWPNQLPPIDLSAAQELDDNISVDIHSLASHQLEPRRQARKDYRLWLLSVTHLVLTISCCSATCVLVAMKAAWERDQRFAVARQCRDGQPPPLAEWALIMSIALLMFAAAAHISLGSQKPMHKLARCLILGICASDLACFLVGNVLVFSAFPNAGCSATWTSAHADYIAALVIIICTYVGYALAFMLICWLQNASDGMAVDMGAETSESTHGADAHAHSLVQLNALGNSAAAGSLGSARRCSRANLRVA